MNRWICLFFTLAMISCIGKHKSDAQKVTVNPTVELGHDLEADTLWINIGRSKIDWFATKMRGTRSRTGTITFKEGFFLKNTDEDIVGGYFTVDMETMENTDIPSDQKIARSNLINHLKSNDFFNVELYPTATLEFTNVEKIKNDSLKISGNFTIREETKNIEFIAFQKGNIFKTTFKFNRLDWNIAYEGSWADKTLVDRDVELNIVIEFFN